MNNENTIGSMSWACAYSGFLISSVMVQIETSNENGKYSKQYVVY